MALVRPYEESEFDPDLLEFVQFFKGPLGVIPNSVRTMARRPAIAKAFTDFCDDEFEGFVVAPVVELHEQR